ncbi:MAG: radical SAM protein [Marinilabiliales bacterium]
MKILLVAPCPANEQRHNTMDIPQLTLSLIAGMTPPEHEVEICEEVYGQIINYDGDYDLIGITIMTQTCIRGYEIANEFKKRDKKVVFGGMHATAHPQEAIMYADAVVIGEAEDGLWTRIINDAKKDKLKEFYKLEKLPDLQNHIYPRRDLIRCASGKFGVAPIETTRGCPYNCDFCSVSRFFGTKQRHKPIPDIIQEAEMCNEKVLFFLDDNITLDKKFVKKLFHELIPLKKKWVGQASINLTKDPELMELAYKSGCRALLVGFESMTDDGINQYRKTLKTVNENILAVKKLRDHGIMTMASLVFGLDSDTPNVFDVSYEFLTKAKPAFFQACALTPYPGTPVFEELKSQNRILTDDWRKYDATKVIISPKNMTIDELYNGYNDIKKSIYSNKSIFNRAFPNMKLGIPEAVFYYTLNRGYYKNNKTKRFEGVQENKKGHPVDFDVTKHVKPVKGTKMKTSTVQLPFLTQVSRVHSQVK